MTWTYPVHVVSFIYKVLKVHERGQGGCPALSVGAWMERVHRALHLFRYMLDQWCLGVARRFMAFCIQLQRLEQRDVSICTESKSSIDEFLADT